MLQMAMHIQTAGTFLSTTGGHGKWFVCWWHDISFPARGVSRPNHMKGC